MKTTNIEKICEYLETSADFINNLPKYIKSQAKNIPEHEIEDFSIGTDEKRREIASLYDAIDLYIMISQYRNKNLKKIKK